MIARASCQLDAAGLPYPRTCPECGFGPCMKRHSDVTGDRQWEKWVSMKHEKAITELKAIIEYGPLDQHGRLADLIAEARNSFEGARLRLGKLLEAEAVWNAQVACYHDAIKALESA